MYMIKIEKMEISFLANLKFLKYVFNLVSFAFS